MEQDHYQDSPRTLAKIAYEGYAEFTGGLTFDGRKMPSWTELNERIRNAWGAAVNAVLTQQEKDG